MVSARAWSAVAVDTDHVDHTDDDEVEHRVRRELHVDLDLSPFGDGAPVCQAVDQSTEGRVEFRQWLLVSADYVACECCRRICRSQALDSFQV